MSDLANIVLSKDLIEPIVRAQLQASIVSALGRADQLVGQVVQTVMNQKVDSDGKPSQYGSATPLISWMADKAIKEAALEAIKEWFADHRDEIKAQIVDAMKKNQKGMAEAYVLSLANAISAQHRSDITIRFEQKGK